VCELSKRCTEENKKMLKAKFNELRVNHSQNRLRLVELFEVFLGSFTKKKFDIHDFVFEELTTD
jgi:hypothetical protein